MKRLVNEFVKEPERLQFFVDLSLCIELHMVDVSLHVVRISSR